VWFLDESTRAGWNAAVTADTGLNSDTWLFIVVDIASITTQADASDVAVSYGGAETLFQYLGMDGLSFGQGSDPITTYFN
jgi:hypothetical protein